jgi:hypothetical protein
MPPRDKELESFNLGYEKRLPITKWQPTKMFLDSPGTYTRFTLKCTRHLAVARCFLPITTISSMEVLGVSPELRSDFLVPASAHPVMWQDKSMYYGRSRLWIHFELG